MASNPTPVQIGPFNLGMNNRLPDTELRIPKVGTYLRSAVNVDVTQPGTLRRREGYASALAGDDTHSLWSHGDAAYVVDGSNLYALSGSPAALDKTLVRPGLTPGVRLSYTESPQGIVCTDGQRMDILVAATYKPLALPIPDPEPLISATSGSLPAGVYQVCITFFDADFRQSGSTTPVSIELTAPGGISLSNLPTAFPADVAGVMVYMTEPDSDVLMLAEVIETPAATLVLDYRRSLTARCPTLLLKPLPGGSIVRHNNGRFFVARDKTLLFSEPFSTLHDPVKGFIPFADPITMVEPLTSGLYVATTHQTFWFAGDITEAAAAVVLPYGAVPGTGMTYPDKLRSGWMSTRGLVQGDDSGQVTNLQEKAVAVRAASAGASLFRERDGLKQVVSSLFGSDASTAAAHSFMDAEVVRKGTSL